MAFQRKGISREGLPKEDPLEGRTSREEKGCEGRASGGRASRRKDIRGEGFLREVPLAEALLEGNMWVEVEPCILMLERIPPREWRDLGIAWFAITLAFTIVFLRDGISSISPATFLLIFGFSAVTVGVGFILHELAHKFAALRYGYWAEFRKDNLMLLVAVVLAALVGVVFAAPGATMIYGPALSRRENGWISAAGPGMNLVLAIPFVAMALAGGGIVAAIGFMGWKVNGMLAAFNMLPVGPLDGKKVLEWNPAAFGLLIAAAFGLLIAPYFI